MRVARRINDRNLVWRSARITYASRMLPILRIIPVGGVFIAILALILGLTLPGPSRARLARVEAPAHGALIEQAEHPEWRQFLILAALHRADEIRQLRGLQDTRVPAVPVSPVEEAALPALDEVTAPPPVENISAPASVVAPPPAAGDTKEAAPVIAGLPADQTEANPGDDDDTTGSITQVPAATIPVEIGESSSTELPVTKSEERPPVIRTPERAKPPGETRRKLPHRAHRRAKPAVKTAATQQPPDLFSALFGPQYQHPQPAPKAQPAKPRQRTTPRVSPSQ